MLRHALAACEEQDLESLHGRTAAGRALVSLSALARGAASALGAAPGASLTDGPGVVVVRDLVSATRQLARWAPGATMTVTSGANVSGLVPTAKVLHAQLLDAMASAA
ncbi:MAG TPA: hypothetical protein VHI11_03900 [Jiangellaceae bacterium]|nr:hypothetical protein [Jiangellaceae bacterium]